MAVSSPTEIKVRGASSGDEVLVKRIDHHEEVLQLITSTNIPGIEKLDSRRLEASKLDLSFRVA